MPHDRLIGFVERRRTVEQIKEWLKTSERVLLITGGAGTGKTALISGIDSRWKPQWGPRVHATHYCQANRPFSADPVRVFASLAGQLARRLPGYAAVARSMRLAHDPLATEDPVVAASNAILDSAGPQAAYDRTLHDPFEVLASTGRLLHDVLVVVDGLDEGMPEWTTQLTKLIIGDEARPTPRLRILVTARPGPIADRFRGTARFDLADDHDAATKDITEFLVHSTSLPKRGLLTIAAAADGCFLYADLAARLSRADQWRLDLRGPLPEGLDGLYRHAFCGRPGLTPLARQVLCLLARTTDDGLTTPQVAGLLNATGPDVGTVLIQWRALLLGTRRVRPHHRCLAEHLSATATDGQTPADFDWLIANQLIKRWASRWRAGSQHYGLRSLLIHLADAGAATQDDDRRQAVATAIAATIADPDFLTTALARVGVDDVLSGMRYVRCRMPSPAAHVDTTAEVLRAQVATLRAARQQNDSGLALQQLVFEAASLGATDLGRALVDRIGSRAILTLWATVDGAVEPKLDARLGHRGRVEEATVMPDGERAITSSRDGTFRVWQLASGRVVREHRTGDHVTDVQATPDATHIVTSDQAGRSQLWDIATGERMDVPEGRATMVSAFAVDRDGVRGISGDADGNATIWNLDAGEPVHRLPCRAEVVTAVAITADGQTAATGSLTGDVVVWDVVTGIPVHRFTLPDRHIGAGADPER